MSSGDQVTIQILTQLVQATDGALLGVGLGYLAVRSLMKYVNTASALRKVNAAPSISVSDLRSFLKSASGEAGGEGSMLVILRGTIEAKSAVEGGKKSLWPSKSVLCAKGSGESAVIIQSSQSCIYSEWRGLIPWTSDLKSIISRSMKEESSSYTRSVPFVVQDSNQSDHIAVDLEGSKHPLPLETVFHELKPLKQSPFTLFQAFFGREYPIGLLEEEKILPVGKDITVVGLCSSKDGVLEIKSCGSVPFFLTELSKDQMVVKLSRFARILKWTGIIVGAASVGILGYSIVRNWRKWRAWKQARREREELHTRRQLQVVEESEDEEEYSGEVPDGQLCVVCLTRRNQSAFIPCGHRVCCQRCALTVERAQNANCPVCRQGIVGSLRIYGS